MGSLNDRGIDILRTSGLVATHAYSRYAGFIIRRTRWSSTPVPAERAIEAEAAGIEFIDENGGGPGVRLRSGNKRKAR